MRYLLKRRSAAPYLLQNRWKYECHYEMSGLLQISAKDIPGKPSGELRIYFKLGSFLGAQDTIKLWNTYFLLQWAFLSSSSCASASPDSLSHTQDTSILRLDTHFATP